MDARRELQGDADAPALRQCFERVQGGKFPGRLRRNVRAICRRHAGIAGRLRSRLQDHTVRSQSDAEWRRFLRSEEHTSELQSLMRISYAVFCLKKKKHVIHTTYHTTDEHTTDS